MAPSLNFLHSNSVLLSDHLQLDEYKSTRSQLKIIFLDRDSPIVDIRFILPFETHDDFGLPHTLEHLIFFGSRKYPKPGILEQLALRAISDGTNGHTSCDCTCYKLHTVGCEGMYHLIPVFLDHILDPVLNEDSFLSEVYHVMEDGKEGGVVFSEMQHHEYDPSTISYLEALRLLYGPESGYQHETGGSMKGLREVSIEMIKKFHKKFFHLDNLTIFLVGKVDHHKILNIAAELETYYLEMMPKIERPMAWVDSKNWRPLNEIIKSVRYFPSMDEETGKVYVSWRGPDWNHFLEREAIELICEYLSESNISLLVKNMVESNPPYCSSVGYESFPFKSTCFSLIFSEVPYKMNDTPNQLENIRIKLFEILSNVLQNGFEMNTIKSIVKRNQQQFLMDLEQSPSGIASDLIDEYSIYGTNTEELRGCFDFKNIYSELLTKSADFWTSILKQFFTDKAFVEVHCLPCSSMLQEIADETAERTRWHKENISKERLQDIKRRVESQKNHHVKFGDAELDSIMPYMDTSKIYLPEPVVKKNFGNSSDGSTALVDILPFPVQLNDIKTNFVYFKLVLRVPEAFSQRQRLLLYLFSELLFECGLKTHSGKCLTHQKVTSLLLENTSDYGASCHLNGLSELPSFMTIYMTSSKNCFFESNSLLANLCKGIQFSAPRVRAKAQSLILKLKKKKRSTSYVMRQFQLFLTYNTDCPILDLSLGKQEIILTEACHCTDTLIEELQAMATVLFNASNMVMHISAEITSIPNEWIKPWFFSQTSQNANIDNLPVFSNLCKYLNVPNVLKFRRSEPITQGIPYNFICSVGGSEDAHLCMSVTGPQGFYHPDMAALFILTEYICLFDGPVIHEVRGSGLAYALHLSHNPLTGIISFHLSPATDVVEGLRLSLSVFKRLVETSSCLSENDLLCAKYAAYHTLISQQETSMDQSTTSFLANFKEISNTYLNTFIKEIGKLKREDVLEAARKYLPPLYNFFSGASEQSKRRIACTIITGPPMVSSIIEKFQAAFDVEIRHVSLSTLLKSMQSSSNETLFLLQNTDDLMVDTDEYDSSCDGSTTSDESVTYDADQ